MKKSGLIWFIVVSSVVVAVFSLAVSKPAAASPALYSSCANTPAAGQAQDQYFFTGVLSYMGIADSQFARNAFMAWKPYENTNACWNPLATTYHVAWFPAGTGCTETIFNSVGVRNYSTKDCGQRATARTLLYTTACGRDCYKPIRDLLSQSSFNWQALHDSVKLWVGSDAYATALTNQWQTLWNNRGTSGGPSGYSFCANENQRCNFSGTKDIAYGANSKFNYRTGITGGIDCNNAVFGDPIYGTVKACYTKNSGTVTCAPNADQIALFIDGNYSGQCVIKGIGSYTNPSAIGLPNDSISSIKVGGNVKTTLCRDDNYGGTCETFTGDDGNLSDNSIGNDQVSSAKVETRSSGGGGNLAKGRTVWATSQESSSYPPSNGNDGNTSTRWSSQISSALGPQWYKVDLGSAQVFNQFIVRWENAYGAHYYVAWCDSNCTSNDSTWYGYERWLNSKQNDVISFGVQTHRYVGIYMVQRAPTMNNYSFWEFEVYNVAATQAPDSQNSSEPVMIESK
jgi:hypothetical protein